MPPMPRVLAAGTVAAPDRRPTPEYRMAELARTFPSARPAADVHLWSARTLDFWAAEQPRMSQERVTAQLLLAVWDPNYSWRCGQFGLTDAMRVWDEPHRLPPLGQRCLATLT